MLEAFDGSPVGHHQTPRCEKCRAWLVRPYRRQTVPDSPLFDHDRGLCEGRVAGVDEVGRGCLAGPLLAAAVVLDYRKLDSSGLVGLHDSKKISKAMRERLYPAILSAAERISLVSIPVSEIDRHGVNRANLDALTRAAQAVAEDADLILVDGFALPIDIPHRRIVKGDATSAAIAAASVVVKVTRDRLMERLDYLYPGYDFGQHAGYLTAAHSKAVTEIGPSPMHRLSFQARCYKEWETKSGPNRSRSQV